MRILFVLKGLVLVRHFDDVLARLADRGHEVLLAPIKFGDDELLPDLLANHPNCSVVSETTKRAELLPSVPMLRYLRDYLRYQEPALADAGANRRRALDHLVRSVSNGTRTLPDDLPDMLLPLNRQEARRIRKWFDDIEHLVPPDPRVAQFIAAQRPDVMLITPLVSFGGTQSDFVKAARGLGIPTGCPVFSWDNLTNKGVMHERPDRTWVWNEMQRREAIDLHGVAPEAVVATGAPRFDPFFQMTPSTDRDRFCAALGLDPTRRLVAYLGSSPMVSPREPAFAQRWMEALRASATPELRDAQVVIRPHPRFKDTWNEHPRFRKKATPEQRYPGVAVHNPKSVVGDQPLFDLLVHADAVVGLNTTAELEAGIVGTPVYTVRAPELAAGQTGSHHFHYLLREHGGFVECANTIEEHLGQLAAGLTNGVDQERIRSFIEMFLRPRGLDRPAAPILADDIERWATEATGRASAGVAPSPDSAVAAPTVPTAPAPPGAGQPEKKPLVYDPHPLFIYVSTHAEREWRLDPGRKEPWTVNWLNDNVTPGDIVYDIGANVGVFSLIAAANLDGQGTVVAFEPGYANFGRLCENIRLNRLTRLIVPVPVPLSHRPGLQWFKYKSTEPGQSRHRFGGKRWDPARDKVKSSEQPVLAMTLDQAVHDFNVPPPTLLKLDVDGAEDLVLRGAASVLRRPELRSLIVEIDPECETAVLETLAGAGLSLAERFKRKKKPGAWYGVFRR